MFIAALFIIAQKQEQPKCSLTGDRINKMWHAHTTVYYSTIERNGVLIYTTTWMNLENIMADEGNQTQKTTYCMIPFI